IGASADGVPVGRFGDAAAFAFYGNKQMTTGEGGMLLTDRDDWAHRARSLRNQGRADDGAHLHHERLGYNYRMSDLSAAVGLARHSVAAVLSGHSSAAVLPAALSLRARHLPARGGGGAVAARAAVSRKPVGRGDRARLLGSGRGGGRGSGEMKIVIVGAGKQG